MSLNEAWPDGPPVPSLRLSWRVGSRVAVPAAHIRVCNPPQKLYFDFQKIKRMILMRDSRIAGCRALSSHVSHTHSTQARSEPRSEPRRQRQSESPRSARAWRVILIHHRGDTYTSAGPSPRGGLPLPPRVGERERWSKGCREWFMYATWGGGAGACSGACGAWSGGNDADRGERVPRPLSLARPLGD